MELECEGTERITAAAVQLWQSLKDCAEVPESVDRTQGIGGHDPLKG